MSNALRGKKFLVVDDEAATIAIVKEVLNQNGAKASGTTQPETCVSMVSREKFDGVILDRYMPGMDGHEVLSQLKNSDTTKGIPVVMLTGESKAEEIKKSIGLGASGYVVKPFTPKSFMAQVNKIFGL